MLQTFPTRTEGSVKKHWYKVRNLPLGEKQEWKVIIQGLIRSIGYALCRIRRRRGKAGPGTDIPHVANPRRGPVQSVALREAIKEYDANKWKVIGQKVGKPAKVSSPIYLFGFDFIP